MLLSVLPSEGNIASVKKKKEKRNTPLQVKILHKREFLYQRVRVKTVINRRECMTKERKARPLSKKSSC